MNIPRIIVAGLAAGLVMNVGDFITGAFLMADEMRAMMSRLGLDAAAMETPEGIIPWVIVDFLYGILIVFTYAAIRPRFGPGPKTAILAVSAVCHRDDRALRFHDHGHLRPGGIREECSVRPRQHDLRQPGRRIAVPGTELIGRSPRAWMTLRQGPRSTSPGWRPAALSRASC
jgi:hypothetical protein